MSIDWSTAPKDATHWEPDSYHVFGSWMKKEGDSWLWWEGDVGRWSPSLSISEQRMGTFEARPQESWNGQGLPPVGTVCIVEPHNTMWGFSSTSGYERKILAYYGEYVWLGHAETPLETTRIDKVDFRPLSTPEQIAAEEREKAALEMAALMSGHDDRSKDCFKVLGEILYDAGYRRQEEGK